MRKFNVEQMNPPRSLNKDKVLACKGELGRSVF